MKKGSSNPLHPPSATYRIQLNHLFTFEMAAKIVPYLEQLGITDVYTSPFLMARPGSLHGYDVTDHSRLNPEIGDEASFLKFSGELQKRGIGLIVDVVPNHMCVTHPSNRWWWDVLENGPSSTFARYFDIDWQPPKQELTNKVLLPILGDQYGRVLENQDIRAAYDDGKFHILVYDNPLPLAPRTWTMILESALARFREHVDPADPHLAELESIITALNHLPGHNTETDEARIQERQREKEIARRRISELIEAAPAAMTAIQNALDELNGRRGDPHSFDRLERLLENQAYRLSYWRVAMDEINYRRFFDINELAAIRPEDPEVFTAVHALIFDLVQKGHVNGLRVDHPDGLFEPEKYFRFLQDACQARTATANAGKKNGSSSRNFYIVAEKILMNNEALRRAWPVEGTTGYDFLNLLNGIFVDRTKEKAFRQLYRRFTGWTEDFSELASDSKRLILQVSMSSELNVLARRLDRLSEQHRWSRDFTLESLRDALREVLATFPVYRTYVRPDESQLDPEDRRQILVAIREAKRRNAAVSASVFDFIASVFLLQPPSELDNQQRAARQDYVMRSQQLTAPVMAKGLEDTAFYRYYPLTSLNEVGGSPDRFGIPLLTFNRRNAIRNRLWPHSMNATSTHDTKRSEDVRARINVLSEMPREWYRAIRRWSQMNRALKKDVEGALAPDFNEEYLLYQTLVGTWPFEELNAQQHASYVARIQLYLRKALREAKIHTSWVNPNSEYDDAIDNFVERLLDRSKDNAFLDDFLQFQAPIAKAGMWNSLCQLILKIASPGIPDFYQGSELWNFHLVDPDNRGTVDFAFRNQALARLRRIADKDREAAVSDLIEHPCDGAIKLYITQRALTFRKAHPALFAGAQYLPLGISGQWGRHVVSFARIHDKQIVLAVASRFFLRLCNSQGVPWGEQTWGNTTLKLPAKFAPASFEDVVTGKIIETQLTNDHVALPLGRVLSHCPVALLFGEGIA